MNYTSLKYFLVVAEEMNITKAAQRLFISQQSLSEHILKLEKEYSVKLFDRTPRLKLTYAGRCMYKFAERAVGLDNELTTEMADISASNRGGLSIGMPPAHGRTLGPDILAEFHREYPNVDLHIVVDNSARIVNQVLSGDLDLAICFSYDVINPRLERIDYLDNSFCLVIPECILIENFHMSPDELLGEKEFDLRRLTDIPVITSSRQSAVQNEFLRRLQRQNIQCKKIISSVRDHQTRLLLCSRGLGVTFTFQLVAQKFVSEYKSPQRLYCIPIDMVEQENNHALSICYLHDRYLSNASSAFIRITQALRPKNLGAFASED